MDRMSAAVYLRDESHALLAEWADQLHAAVPASRSFENLYLLYRFDELIAEIAGMLDDPAPDFYPRIALHISQMRAWYFGYDLDEIVREYQLLQRVILGRLKDADPETRFTVERYFEKATCEAIKENLRITREATRADETGLKTILDQARCILLSAEVSRSEGEDGPHLGWVPLRYDAKSAEAVLPLENGPGEDFFKAWERLRHPPKNVTFQQAIDDADFRDGDLYTQAFSVTDRFGQLRWLREEVSVQALAEDRWRIVGVIIDITERMRAEEELKEADRQKDLFLAMLAHELRNPLAPVRNAVCLLNMEGRDDPALRRTTEIIERQVSHMARMVDDLLDASRIKREKVTLKKEPTDLIPLLRSTLENIRPLLEAKGQVLDVQLPDEPVWVDADPARLDQVISNLLDNAVKYTPEGGRIGLTAEREGEEATIRVRDNGQGIVGDLLPHVFDLFTQADHTLDRAKGGLGLGLSIVKGLVDQHGGRISARSEGEGRGSEFSVRLPCLPQGTEADTSCPDLGESGVALPRRILLVEDNLDAADTLKSLLEMCGHDVRAVHDGLDAIRLTDEYRPDIVLLDIGLPGLDGHSVAARLRERPDFDGVKLIALSGYERKTPNEAGKGDAFDHYLLKPVDFLRLQALLLPDKVETASA